MQDELFLGRAYRNSHRPEHNETIFGAALATIMRPMTAELNMPGLEIQLLLCKRWDDPPCDAS